MKDQINTIRYAIEMATPHYQADTERFKQALTALAQLEKVVGAQEPVAWAMPKGDGTFIDVITPAEHARDEGSYTVPLFAHPIAQQPQAEAVPMKTRRVTYTCPACAFSLERDE